MPRSWRALGAVLPRSIREGVFEPAYSDLWRAIVLDPRRKTRRVVSWLTLGAYLLVAVWYAAPRYVTEVPTSRRARWATRLGLAITAVVLILLVVPRLVMRFAYY